MAVAFAGAGGRLLGDVCAASEHEVDADGTPIHADCFGCGCGGQHRQGKGVAAFLDLTPRGWRPTSLAAPTLPPSPCIQARMCGCRVDGEGGAFALEGAGQAWVVRATHPPSETASSKEVVGLLRTGLTALAEKEFQGAKVLSD